MTSSRPLAQVLIVEDEPLIADVLKSYLDQAGYSATIVDDGAVAVEHVRAHDPDVVILDLGLPSLDGVEVCRRIRTFSDCYVIMVTARDDEVDTLIGLSVGADDYLTKPCSARQLVARVQTMLRRPRTPAAAGGEPDETHQVNRVFGGLTIDPVARVVTLDGALIDLTRTEFDVLDALAARPRLAFSRRQLVDSVWGTEWIGDEHLVDVHIGKIRRKLGEPAGSNTYIVTIRGVGYRMGTGDVQL